jgi:hypothetical protein
MRNTISAPTDDLCRKILEFEIDEGVPELSFRDRLARENGWTKGYAQRVIDEYLRFVYLAMVSGHVVTPSDQVDQAWHLHLTYTRSYWDRLCGEVLKRPLHHGPTRGGTAESVKYHDQYARTIESYAKLFGQSPPADIWPPSEIRFGSDLSHVRVNRSRHWVIPKPRSLQVPSFFKLALGTCLLVCLSANLGGTNQHQMAIGGFDLIPIGERINQSLKGTTDIDRAAYSFEVLLAGISLSIFILHRIHRKTVRGFPGGSDIDLPDFDSQAQAQAEALSNVEIARLLGNNRRSVEVALTELTTKGLCRVSDDNQRIIRNDFTPDFFKLMKDARPDKPELRNFDLDDQVFNLSPLSKLLLASLPLNQDDQLDNLKTKPTLHNASMAIESNLIQQRLLPLGNLSQDLSDLDVLFPVLFVISVSLMFVSAGTVIGAPELSGRYVHMIILISLGMFLMKMKKTISIDREADRKLTRRGQVVANFIKSRLGMDYGSQNDLEHYVAVHGPGILSTCPDPELKRLYEWLNRNSQSEGGTTGGCAGCGGCGGCGCGG